MHDAYPQVPQEITSRKTLNHPSRASVPPNPLLPSHPLPLLISEHDPQRSYGDEDGLEQRDDMDIPVEFGSRVELGVGSGEETSRDVWREVRVDQRVGERREEELVDMIGESGET